MSSFLLINPDALVLQNYYDVFRVIHQRKVDNKPIFQFDSLISQNTRLVYPGSDPAIIALVKCLDPNHIKNEIGKLSKIHTKQKGGVSFDTYISRSVPRIFHELLNRVTAVSHELKFYHRLKNKQTGNYKVAPCTFAAIKPSLSFKVNKSQAGEFFITPNITISGQTFPLEDFNGATFLLEKDSVYYLLSIKDSQTLDWLVKARPEQYKDNPEAFTEQIVSVLERDYDVTKDEAFKINLIETPPQHAVQLSEISD
ncbi:MAG TPA: hypothetical protein VK174_11845, partial [Chitinophagales bacterium]|nr:hypothetical protein [Chitinophagales bacterium]